MDAGEPTLVGSLIFQCSFCLIISIPHCNLTKDRQAHTHTRMDRHIVQHSTTTGQYHYGYSTMCVVHYDNNISTNLSKLSHVKYRLCTSAVVAIAPLIFVYYS